MNKTKRILFSALFIAATIVLARFLSIRTPIITIGFSFIPIMFSAIMLGPKYSTFIATISDIIGALLFPSGSYFFGFTISSLLTGLVYGLFLYNKEFKINKIFIIKLVISTLIVTLIINGILNTIWIMMISKGASNIIVPIRVIKQLIMVPIKIASVLGLGKALESRINKVLND